MCKGNKPFCMITLSRKEVRSFLQQYLWGDTRKNIFSGKTNGEVGTIAWVDGVVSFTGDFQKQGGRALDRNSPDTDDPDSDPDRQMNYMTSWNSFNPIFFLDFISILPLGGTELLCTSMPHQWNRSITGQIKQINENHLPWAWLSGLSLGVWSLYNVSSVPALSSKADICQS